MLSLLWPLLELRLEHFSQSTSLCPQTSWNTTVCVLSRGLLHLGFPLSHNCFMSQGCICFPLNPAQNLAIRGLVIQAWVSAPSPAPR